MDYSLAITIIFLGFLSKLIDSALGMLYGSIAVPVLLVFGFNPIVIVPCVISSQVLGSIIATSRHHRYGNVDLHSESKDRKKIFAIIIPGIVAVIIGSFLALEIPAYIIESYIALLVIIAGTIILLKLNFKFSWNKMWLIGALSSFNIAITGAGFGAFLTGGQIAIGQKSKNAIALSTIAKIPIGITALIIYFTFSNFSEWLLLGLLSFGAMIGAMIGPKITSITEETKLRNLVGTITFVLGIYLMLLKINVFWVF